MAQAAVAAPAAPRAIDLPAQPLEQTLTTLAQQAGRRLLVAPDLVAGKMAPAVQGSLTVDEALRQVLAGSGLEAVVQGETLVVRQRLAPAGEEAMTLPEVVVQDDRAEGVAVQEASSALKLGVPLMETPQSVSVIPALQLEVQGVNRYSEAFRYTPGIQAEPFGQEIRRTWLRLRGFDSSQDALFKDGLKLANNTFIAAYSLEPYGAERLEVPRGPASVLYGQGSPGGLVNYITKRPQFTPFHEAMFQAGSFERYQGQFETTGPLNKEGTLAYRLTSLFRDSATQIDHVDDDRI